jgi:hypothetical protein
VTRAANARIAAGTIGGIRAPGTIARTVVGIAIRRSTAGLSIAAIWLRHLRRRLGTVVGACRAGLTLRRLGLLRRCRAAAIEMTAAILARCRLGAIAGAGAAGLRMRPRRGGVRLGRPPAMMFVAAAVGLPQGRRGQQGQDSGGNQQSAHGNLS